MSNDEVNPRIQDEGAVYSPPPSMPPITPDTASSPIPEPEPSIIARYKKPLIITLIILGVIVGTLVAASTIGKQKPVSTAPTPTPTATPSPTPMRHVALTATTSAFLSFNASLSTLSATLQGIQITDSTLTPPTIELPLGFANQ